MAVTTIPQELLSAYQARTFRLQPGLQLKDRDHAVHYVKERGFVYFWPIKGIRFPSLWTAVAGDRPVADAHDDPGHITWGWKDALLGSHQWYYAKILRKKATMVAMDMVPYFYALSENYGSPDEDYLTLYEQGRLTREARKVYEVILDQGPIDTVALRQAAHLTSKASKSPFNRALAVLQADFKIVPVGVAKAGAWRYAFQYDICARHYPDIPEQARFIDENSARLVLVEKFFRSVGAAQARDVVKLFGWPRPQVEQSLSTLTEQGTLLAGIQVEGQPGRWFLHSDVTND